MSKEEYILESFPSDEEMERAARKCTMLAYCPDRPFSFCLKKWVEVDGELRGCIGTIAATTDCIAEEIIQNAISASTKDPRFNPIAEEELPFLDISVDVLGDAEEIASPAELDVKRYGVIVTKGFRRGLLLPDLEGVDTVEDQISIAKRKAGIYPEEKVKLERFEVIRHH